METKEQAKKIGCMGTIGLTVYWNVKDPAVRDKIRKRFGIPKGMNVNWQTKAQIQTEDLPLLEETARRGFLSIKKNTRG